jgi:N-acetylneuraminic acid mutarotase
MWTYTRRAALCTLGFTTLACGDPPTQPTTVEDQPIIPQLALASNTWLTRRDMPLDLFEQTIAVVPNAAGQSILYAMGGGKVDSPLPGAPVPMGEVRAYNVATNTWTSKQDMPVARWGMNGAGVIGGKIYVTGGFTKAGLVTASLLVYDIASNTWTQKRSMPAAGGDGVTGVIGGKLYVVAFNYPDYKKQVNFFRYNPTTDSWTRLPSPTGYPSLNVGGGVIDGKLYLTGRTEATQEPPWIGSKSPVLEYDPLTNHWTQKRPWTNQACVLAQDDCFVGAQTVVVFSHLYVIGGYSAGRSNGTGIFIYHPISDSWESKPLLTTFSYWDVARLAAARVFLNGKPRVEVIGGYRPGNNQQYIP